MDTLHFKLTAVQGLLETWCQDSKLDINAMTWLDKVGALGEDIPISPQGEAITLKKQIEVKILHEKVCGATIPTAYAYSNRFSPGPALCPPPSLSPQGQGPYPP